MTKHKVEIPLYGIIGIALSILTLFTPKLFFFLMLGAITVFTLIGYVKDNTMIASILSTIMIVVLSVINFYSEPQPNPPPPIVHDLEYRVSCIECEIQYTGEDGKNIKIQNKGYWSKTIKVKSGGKVRLIASIDKKSPNNEVSGSISLDGEVVSSEGYGREWKRAWIEYSIP